jgi:lipopolysaccharide transport system permease protein
MVGVIDGFRWALLGGDTTFSPARLALSTLVVAVVFTTGFLHFRRTERVLADVI